MFTGLGEPVTDAKDQSAGKGGRSKVQAERTYGRMEFVDKLAERMEGDEKGWYQGMGRKGGKGTEMFDVMAVCKGKKETFVHTDLPGVFRTHWSKCVFPFPFSCSFFSRQIFSCAFRMTAFYTTSILITIGTLSACIQSPPRRFKC